MISISINAQNLNNARTPVFVISTDDIMRFGTTNTSDALWLVPGLDVAWFDTNEKAVSLSGFDGRFPNKLQVLIDSPSAYPRIFSGMYTKNHDVMIENINRIKVILGSSVALWGENTINRVITIISKNFSKNQGGSLNISGGTQERDIGLSHFGTLLPKDSTTTICVDSNPASNTHVQDGFCLELQSSTQDKLNYDGDIYNTPIKDTVSNPQATMAHYGRIS
jgi:iron complex outermembrane recepter protein